VRTRLLHVSDLHVGAPRGGGTEELAEAFAALVEVVSPQLVIVSGDVTHRGRPAQHAAAAEVLRGPGRPLLVVPGNHDAPHTVPGRFVGSWGDFERVWETTEPVHAAPEVHVVGLNSVRVWRHQSGRLDGAQLSRAAKRLGAAAPGALRVVAFHHQLIGAPWRSRKRPLLGRSDAFTRLVGAGADLVVGGHIHQAAVSERREFEVDAAGGRPVVVTVAPGLGRPRPNRRGEARGALVYDVEPDALEITTWLAAGGGWVAGASRRVARAG
jgi:3',5'-cyclic AMP phosphodiesterase CpdA